MFLRNIFIFCLIFLTSFSMLAAGPVNKSPEAGIQSTVVLFKDPGLEEAVRRHLNKPTGDITDADMATLTKLSNYIQEGPPPWERPKRIKYLDGLEYAVNLNYLSLINNRVYDLSPIRDLTKLTYLNLKDNTTISSLEPLKNLINLEIFIMNFAQWTGKRLFNLDGLENCNNLKELKLSGNWCLNDISALENLTQLHKLDLLYTTIANSDLQYLYNLDKLTFLRIESPGITSGTAVQQLADNLDLLTCEEIHKPGNITCGVDPDRAQISGVQPRWSGVCNQKITVEATSTNSAGEDMQMKIDWGDGYVVDYGEFKPNASGYEFFHSYSTPGEYPIKVIARSRSGAETAWSSAYTIEIEGSNSAPEPQLNSITPNPVDLGQSVTLMATASDAEGEPVQMRVDWGDGTPFEDSPFKPSGVIAEVSPYTYVTNFSFTHTYAASGEFDIRVIARDNSDLESEWTEARTVTVNAPPTAAISSVNPNPAETAQTVTVAATASDPENQQVMLQIDWGDGTISPFSALQASGSTFAFTHVYATPGNYEIKVLPKDEFGLAGEWSAPEALTVNRANTGPVCTITNVSPNPAETGALVTVQTTVTDAEGDRVRVKIDWGDGVESNYTSWAASGATLHFTHAYSSPGEYPIVAVARDELDLKGDFSAPASVQIIAPNHAPTATISQVTPAAAATGETITVQATATDAQNEMVQMKIDWGNGQVTDYSALQASGSVFTFTNAFATAGNYRIRAMSRDASGQESGWSNAVFVNIHDTGTELVASVSEIVPNPASVNQNVTVHATAVDAGGQTVQMQIDWGNGTISPYSATQASGSIFEFTHIFADTGNFAVKVRAKNAGGTESDWSAPQLLAVKSGNLAPEARVLSAQPNPAETNQPVTVQLSATDPNGDPVSLQIDWGDGRVSDYTEFRPSGSVFEFTPAYPNPGSYLIRARGKDEAGLEGNWSAGFSLEVTPPNFAPRATISNVNPNPVEIGATVTVQITAEDPGSDSVQCRVDWGDGNVSDFSEMTPSGAVHEFSHNYATVGNFALKAQSRDTHGLEGTWSTPVNLIVKKPNQPPAAYIKSLSPMTTTIGSPVNLVAAAADSNHDRVQVQVDWGDGDLSAYSVLQAENTLANFSHSYNAAGTFGIKVRGKDENDAEGDWSAPMSVTIREVNVAPVARIDSISANPLLVGQSLFVLASATDLNTNDQVQIRLDWGDGTFSDFSTARASGVSASFTKIYSTAGEFQLKVIARDAAGLEGAWSAPRLLQVIRPNTAPRDSIVSISPKPAAPNADVTVQARAWDAENDALQMKINWGDGDESPYASSQASGSLFSFTHRYAAVGEYPVSITTKDPAGLESAGSSSTISVQPADAVANDRNQVFEYTLRQNYPNPFNNSTVIEYSLKESGPVAVQIFDPNGKEVRQLVSTPRERGIHRVIWDATDNAGNPVSSGLYFYRLKAKNQVLTKKLILLK